MQVTKQTRSVQQSKNKCNLEEKIQVIHSILFSLKLLFQSLSPSWVIKIVIVLYYLQNNSFG